MDKIPIDGYNTIGWKITEDLGFIQYHFDMMMAGHNVPHEFNYLKCFSIF